MDVAVQGPKLLHCCDFSDQFQVLVVAVGSCAFPTSAEPQPVRTLQLVFTRRYHNILVKKKKNLNCNLETGATIWLKFWDPASSFFTRVRREEFFFNTVFIFLSSFFLYFLLFPFISSILFLKFVWLFSQLRMPFFFTVFPPCQRYFVSFHSFSVTFYSFLAFFYSYSPFYITCVSPQFRLFFLSILPVFLGHFLLIFSSFLISNHFFITFLPFFLQNFFRWFC